MPVEWLTDTKAPAPPGAFAHRAPVLTVRARPHQSMTPGGFVLFMGATAVLAVLPLLSVLGTPVLWGLLPFLALAFTALWAAIARNRDDAGLTETLTLGEDRVELVRREPGGAVRRWEANPHWVTLRLHPGPRPVKHYLTLRGAGREVEFGAFLSPEERVSLHQRLVLAFGGLPGHPSATSAPGAR